MGSPCYSSGETWCSELILINALDLILMYLQEVALTPDFENAPVVVRERPPPAEEFTEDGWKDVPEEEKPMISTQDAKVIKAQVKEARRMRIYVETGELADSDDDDPDIEEVERPDLLRSWDDL